MLLWLMNLDFAGGQAFPVIRKRISLIGEKQSVSLTGEKPSASLVGEEPSVSLTGEVCDT